MPIQFRCHRCRQVLSITSKKAGQEVVCPNCRESTRVPTMADVEAAVKSAPPRPAAPDVASAPPAAASSSPRPRHVEEPQPDHWTGTEPNPWLDEEADEDHGHRPKRRKAAEESRPDMTPMADIVFLLLTFFMLTASFTVQKSMPATPPEPDEDAASSQAVAVEAAEDESVVVEIAEDDKLTIDGETISSPAALTDVLRAKLAESGGNAELTIEMDPRCSIGATVSVMDAGLTVGMQRIRRLPKPIN